ncbi:hypothetical protein R1flu_004932 [Riccia fluitans]|uniref:Uncharacterized protein n=1 Tax=Riccia fluitans TaxID=41844 RepID=A0ABD1YRP5_9MARC
MCVSTAQCEQAFSVQNHIKDKYRNTLTIARLDALIRIDLEGPEVTYLEPRTGESTILKAKNGANIKIRASPGPILGPPWQRPENGYFIEVENPKFSIYYEPHCIFENAKLEGERADIVLTPVVQQVLPGYVLVSGQEDAVKVTEWLKPKFIVTMKNGDLDAKGILASMVSQKGTNESFTELLSKKLPETEVLDPVPGVPLEVPICS